MQNTNSEYILTSIVLIESFFKRIPNVNFTSPEYKNNISVNIETQKEDMILNVSLGIKIQSGISNSIDVEAEVKMLGSFQKNTNVTDLDIETFGQVNAPAIIFPFVREHLASLSTKAGIPTILLPPMNFVKMAEVNKSKKSSTEI